MKVYKNRLTPYRDFSFEGKLDLSPILKEKDLSPLLGVKECEADVTVYLGEDEKIHADYRLESILEIRDSRTYEPYEENSLLEGSLDILSSPTEEGDGYIFEGSSFELEELCLLIIKTSLPLAPRKEGSTLPGPGVGYEVYQEGEKEDGEFEFVDEERKVEED